MDETFSSMVLLSGGSITVTGKEMNKYIYPITMPRFPFSLSIYYLAISHLCGFPFVRQALSVAKADLGLLGSYTPPTTAPQTALSTVIHRHIPFMVYLFGESPSSSVP